MPDQPGDQRWGTTSRKVLDFLTGYVAEHGYAPSVREVADGVGVASTSTVSHQLNLLAARGYIRRDARIPRGIVLLDHES